MENTVFCEQVCNAVKPSLVFHTGGMFVIRINVSIFRMATKKTLYSCTGSSVCDFEYNFYTNMTVSS